MREEWKWNDALHLFCWNTTKTKKLYIREVNGVWFWFTLSVYSGCCCGKLFLMVLLTSRPCVQISICVKCKESIQPCDITAQYTFYTTHQLSTSLRHPKQGAILRSSKVQNGTKYLTVHPISRGQEIPWGSSSGEMMGFLEERLHFGSHNKSY